MSKFTRYVSDRRDEVVEAALFAVGQFHSVGATLTGQPEILRNSKMDPSSPVRPSYGTVQRTFELRSPRRKIMDPLIEATMAIIFKAHSKPTAYPPSAAQPR